MARTVRTSQVVAHVIAFVLLLLPAGYVAFLALLVIAAEIGDRSHATLALLVAGLGVLCGIAAVVFAGVGKTNRSVPLILAAFLLVVIALLGVVTIPTHGE